LSDFLYWLAANQFDRRAVNRRLKLYALGDEAWHWAGRRNQDEGDGTVIVEHEGLDTPVVEEIACLCRGDLRPETLGLSLAEGKALLAKVQETMVTHQVAAYVEQQRSCPACGRRRGNKGKHDLGRLTVGIDGGYVHACEGNNRKAGWFEVIVGKSVPAEGAAKRLGFVLDYDQKPQRRLYEMLQAQELQLNQPITFLSDGGDTVRQLQLYLSSQAEHMLDWFHISMRLTVMVQMAKGLPTAPPFQHLAEDLERVKWYLWHGNVFQALQVLEHIEMDLE
jgi:hypothetical protein